MNRLVKLFALVAVLALGAPSALAGSITVTGTVPKTLTAATPIPLTLTIKNINATTEYPKGANDAQSPDDANLAARLLIGINECDNTSWFQFTAALAVNAPCAAYVTSARAHEERQETDGTWTYVYYVNVIGTTSKLADTVNPVSQITVRAKFFLGDTAKATPIAATTDPGNVLTKESYVITDTPAFDAMGIQGTNRQLTVKFTAADNVNVKGAAGASTKPADSVTVYRVDPTVVPGSKSLPAHSASLDIKVEDKAASCTYTTPTSDAGDVCISCTGDNVYLTPSEIDAIPGFKSYTVPAKAGMVNIPGLTNGSKYWIFMEYQPQGTGFTKCYFGKPSPNFSLTEINGEGDANYQDFRCFIATAAYGSAMAPDVKRFRKFRDDVLLKSAAGRAFVDTYYEVSPPVAGFIAKHETLRAVTRGVLAGPAWLLRQAQDLN
jgi:hypothetical protein